MSIMYNLIKVPAKCGCEGCYFDTEAGCALDKYIEEKGLPLPPPETWECNDTESSYIFIDKQNKEDLK